MRSSSGASSPRAISRLDPRDRMRRQRRDAVRVIERRVERMPVILDDRVDDAERVQALGASRRRLRAAARSRPARGSARVANHEPPPSGDRPTLTYAITNFAPSAGDDQVARERERHARHPAAAPSTAAITGLVQPVIARVMRCSPSIESACTCGGCARFSSRRLRLPPAQNVPSAPVSTTARIDGSCRDVVERLHRRFVDLGAERVARARVRERQHERAVRVARASSSAGPSSALLGGQRDAEQRAARQPRRRAIARVAVERPASHAGSSGASADRARRPSRAGRSDS